MWECQSIGKSCSRLRSRAMWIAFCQKLCLLFFVLTRVWAFGFTNIERDYEQSFPVHLFQATCDLKDNLEWCRYVFQAEASHSISSFPVTKESHIFNNTFYNLLSFACQCFEYIQHPLKCWFLLFCVLFILIQVLSLLLIAGY